MSFVLMLLLAVALGLGIAWIQSEAGKPRTPEEAAARGEALRTAQWGPKNTAMICPHCQTRGSVRVKSVTRKKGISGGKATAALLTSGVSMLATGLSRKEGATRAHCENCSQEWDF